MEATDLSEVLAIERNAQPSPWGRVSFEESLVREHVCRVAVLQDDFNKQTILAYHVVCVIADELHILNLVVASAYQGQGIAHFLMQDIVEEAQSADAVRHIILEVRASNKIAQRLYQQWQFEQISLRKNYYRTQTSQREDALILARKS